METWESRTLFLASFAARACASSQERARSMCTLLPRCPRNRLEKMLVAILGEANYFQVSGQIISEFGQQHLLHYSPNPPCSRATVRATHLAYTSKRHSSLLTTFSDVSAKRRLDAGLVGWQHRGGARARLTCRGVCARAIAPCSNNATRDTLGSRVEPATLTISLSRGPFPHPPRHVK